MTASTVLWIGTFPAGPDAYPEGSAIELGEGIWRVEVAADRFVVAEQQVVAPAPSFLALGANGRVVYAACETDPGQLRAYSVTQDGGLELFGPPRSSGGSRPCHLAVVGSQIRVANYADGAFAIRDILPDGRLGPQARTWFRPGAGPDADRQEGSHAHFVLPLGEDSYVSDLGADILRRYPTDDVAAALPPGTGPRHIALLPGRAIAVVGELDPGVFILVPDQGRYRVARRYDVCATDPVEGPVNAPSHVAAVGDRLLVAVRGANVLSAFAIEPGPEPVLRHVADTAVGAWPRHFAAVGDDRVVIANQHAGTLQLLRLGPDARGSVLDTIAVPAPACVLPALARPQPDVA